MTPCSLWSWCLLQHVACDLGVCCNKHILVWECFQIGDQHFGSMFRVIWNSQSWTVVTLTFIWMCPLYDLGFNCATFPFWFGGIENHLVLALKILKSEYIYLYNGVKRPNCIHHILFYNTLQELCCVYSIVQLVQTFIYVSLETAVGTIQSSSSSLFY